MPDRLQLPLNLYDTDWFAAHQHGFVPDKNMDSF
jgi:hypothetical protein